MLKPILTQTYNSRSFWQRQLYLFGKANCYPFHNLKPLTTICQLTNLWGIALSYDVDWMTDRWMICFKKDWWMRNQMIYWQDNKSNLWGYEHLLWVVVNAFSQEKLLWISFNKKEEAYFYFSFLMVVLSSNY